MRKSFPIQKRFGKWLNFDKCSFVQVKSFQKRLFEFAHRSHFAKCCSKQNIKLLQMHNSILKKPFAKKWL